MKLVASVICRNELGRYLAPFVAHLLEFCDEIRVLDDGSTDGSFEWLAIPGNERVFGSRLATDSFFDHEGAARQRLLEWTLEGEPTHILAIDADEFVSDGAALRAACEADQGPGAWAVGIEEVWKADPEHLWIRQDGGWGLQSRSPLLYRVPAQRGSEWRIMDRALACGREPLAVRKIRARPVDATVLHFGWAREEERAARYQRYVEHDGGKFHARAHLDSIMFDDSLVRLRARAWPAALEPWKAAILGEPTWAETSAREFDDDPEMQKLLASLPEVWARRADADEVEIIAAHLRAAYGRGYLVGLGKRL